MDGRTTSFLFLARLAVSPAAERLEKEQPEISNLLDASQKSAFLHPYRKPALLKNVRLMPMTNMEDILD